MIAVKDKKIWFLREGLFTKYVVSLVGLVVFVLAVNGATETWISYRAAACFAGDRAFTSISVARSGFNAGITVADIGLSFLSDYLGDTQVGKAAFAYVADPRGQVIATSSRGPDLAKDVSKLPQVAA